MKIKKDKVFEPLIITLETKDEYDSFFRIIDEVLDIEKSHSQFIRGNDRGLASALANYATNNV